MSEDSLQSFVRHLQARCDTLASQTEGFLANEAINNMADLSDLLHVKDAFEDALIYLGNIAVTHNNWEPADD